MTVAKKYPIQAVQVTKWRLLKMTVAKKNRIKQCKLPKNTFQKWRWKKTEPNCFRYKMAHFKNDCGPKNPNQTVQDSKKHLLKMTVAKKPDQTVRYKMAPLKNDWPKKSHPSSATYKNGAFSKWLWPKKTNSVKYKMAPFKNDCGPKIWIKQWKIYNVPWPRSQTFVAALLEARNRSGFDVKWKH